MMPGSAAALFSALPSPREGRAAARTAPDLHQASFQGRLMQHLQKADGLETAPTPRQGGRPETGELPLCPPGGRPAGSVRLLRRRPESLACRADGGAVIPPELLPELARHLTAAGVPEPRVQEFLSRPGVQEEGLCLAELREFLLKLAGRPGDGAAPGTPGGAGAEKEAVLADLLDRVAVAPGGGLKLPTERRPEAQLLLQAAGLTPDQAAKLLWHPGVAETGLTPELVRSQWLKARNPELREAAAPGSGAVETWRQLWERLRLPAEAWPELKTALQHLGIPPEQLARLEEGAPDGLPLAQVWRLLRDRQEPQAAPEAPEELARKLADRLDPEPQAAAQRWAGLLRQAGLSEEMVATLWGRASPGSAEELKARLLKLAPEPAPPPAQDAPKPLYLPARLRLAPLPRQFEGEEGPAHYGNDDFGSPKPPLSASPHPGAQESAFAGAVQEFWPAASAVSGPAAPALPATPAWRQAVWSQIENTVLQHLQPGRTQVSLTLTPPELGRVELALTLQGERLMVQALVSRPEVAELAQAQVEQLVQALARQGLILSQFQVQLPPASRLLAAAAPAGDRSGFRRPEEGPTGHGTSRRRQSQGVDFFA